MIKKTSSSSLQLCSRCLTHEVNSWINDRWQYVDEDTKRRIREELKTIKLIIGNCIVCSNDLVSAETTEKIYNILKESQVPKKLKEEFKKFFCV
jgi:hypothetical protein